MSDLNTFGTKSFFDLNLAHYAPDKDKRLFKKRKRLSPNMFAVLTMLAIFSVSFVLLGTIRVNPVLFCITALATASLVIFWMRREFKVETVANNAHQAFIDTVESTYGTLKSPIGVVIGGLHSATIEGKERFAYLTLADDNITPLLVDEAGNILLPSVGHESKLNKENIIDESFTEVFVK